MRISTSIKKRGRNVVIFCTKNHHHFVCMITVTGNYLLAIYTYALIFMLFLNAIYWMEDLHDMATKLQRISLEPK